MSDYINTMKTTFDLNFNINQAVNSMDSKYKYKKFRLKRSCELNYL